MAIYLDYIQFFTTTNSTTYIRISEEKFLEVEGISESKTVVTFEGFRQILPKLLSKSVGPINIPTRIIINNNKNEKTYFSIPPSTLSVNNCFKHNC